MKTISLLEGCQLSLNREKVRIEKAFRQLRRQLPTFYPVRIRWARMDAAKGLCNFDRRRRQFLITFNPESHPAQWTDLLIHEYAHTLAWTHEKLDDHGPMWGVA